jgi:hypothetical protein
MGFDVSRRVGIYVLGAVGAGIVFEDREDGRRVPVRILAGPEAARRWTESRYQGLDWESPHKATALVGRLTPANRTSAGGCSGPVGGRPPLTYESSQFRTYLPELVCGEERQVVVQRCEEHVAEPDQWEPFVIVLWESTS